MSTKKMILDLDTGIDDAMAIAYAVADPDVDLIGIIGSYGNVYVKDGCINSLKILELLGKTDVPVYLGESHSLATDHFDRMEISAQIHGENGIGQVNLPDPKRQLEAGSGIDFLIASAKQYGQNLIYVPTGPMTNLAKALEKDRDAILNIGNVTFMGGALTVEGNVTVYAEANIHQDAEAANTVLRSPLKLTMVGLDVTIRTLLTRKETSQWRELNTPSGTVFADMVDSYIDAYKTTNAQLDGCALHDPLAVGVAIDQSFVSTLDLNMLVATDPEHYGRTIGDQARINSPETNVKVGLTVDRERYLNAFMDHLTGLFKQH